MFGGFDEKLEEAYTKTIQRSAKYAEHFPKAMGMLVEMLEENRTDVLGKVLEEWGQADKAWKGQCFTPDSVCAMMAQIAVEGLEKPTEVGRRIRISEPACGAGAMCVAVANELKSLDWWPWHYHIYAVDVDWRCYAMCFLQLNLLGVPATVTHGNTLTLEEWESSTTLAGLQFPDRYRGEQVDDKAEDSEAVELVTKPAVPAVQSEATQSMLF